MAQMDVVMKQVTQGQTITPEVERNIGKGQADALAMTEEILDWQKLEPMYVRVSEIVYAAGDR